MELPDNTLEISPRSGGHETATASVLNGETYVESTGVSSQSFDISVRFDGDRRATWKAAALEMLGTNPALGVLPLGGSTHVGVDGYYVPSSTRRAPGFAEAREADLEATDASESLTLTLERAGTRKQHYLALVTSPGQPDPGHPFGNDTTGIVGIPADARRVRIVDSTSSPTERERPTPVETVETAHGAIDLFDATSEAIDEPIYLYDHGYDLQGDVDPTVWDSHGEGGQYDVEGSLAWGRVYSTGYVFDGEIVLENGLLRITIDEPTNADETASLDVEEYDAGADSWSTVDLPSYDADLDTDWEPADVDLTHIGQASVRAQIEFEAVAGDQEGDIYAVDVELERGHSELEVWRLSGTGEIPTDLEVLLDPIASTSIVDSSVEQGLVARAEVRR
ncbi:hypothetical protein [Halorubrum trueperi]|uniref:Uncharacterized protein n=1 Tax=Halorubrum trueperi TaxID=2004704 RepID=A0ABD5UER7_9EURY